ncbi:FAD/NAD(P)-binding protein [Methylocystis sp. ATCC 49242]|uniref:FAD/NAD(P)-binding protein n=1 Tax=Methylocystis sp. ATCC 49242 TaxID=622637 RepID=UPI0001F8687A|nr:FAD/NAD(P)-binding protein [Methylocystis sp. ATCC 49242]
MESLTPALDRLVKRLDALPPRAPAIELAKALEAELEVCDVAAFVEANEHNYNRALVAVREHYEALVMTWAPGQASAPHDHGGSACVMKVLQGRAAEGSYHIAADGFVDLEYEEILNAGEIASLQDSGVHSIRNASLDDETLVTIHVYAPPLQASRRFVTRSRAPGPTANERTPTIAIIGGGFSGAMTAAHILRGAKGPVNVTLLERRGALGEGVAYATQETAHLLNVPAGRMSAFPDRPNDFVEWASRRYGAVLATDFLPRRWYGEYVRETLLCAKDSCRDDARLGIAFDEVRRVARRPGGGWTLHLGRGSSISADIVVLAIGHCPPSDPLHDKWSQPRTRFISDPWRPFAMDRVRPDEPVLVLGSGLTAVDAVLSLARQPRTAPITLISTHGLLPQSHAATPLPVADLSQVLTKLLAASGGVCAADLFRALRRAFRDLGASGWDWRSVVDGVRPYTAQLWRAMSVAERRRFMSRLRPFWEVHRHRMAFAVGERFSSMLEKGELSILSGQVVSAQQNGDNVRARVRLRGGRGVAEFDVAWVVNCTGPMPSNRPESNPAIDSLLSQGRLRLDELALGVETTAEGNAISADGAPILDMYVVGTLRKPALWESTAVPELREQAAGLASEIIARLPQTAK